MNINKLAKRAIVDLKKHTDPERKAHTENYFPSSQKNLSVVVPGTRKVLSSLKKVTRTEPADSVLKLGNQ